MKDKILIKSPKYGEFNVLVDEEDYEILSKYNWHIRRCYSQNHECYYAGSHINKKLVLMHRFLMGEPKGMVVDHINHDKLDNRKENLRVCTFSDNRKNNNSYKNNTSGYKGVLWYDYCKTPKWMAYIMVDNKQINLGYFDELEDAIRARNEAELSYFGDFANMPNE